MSDPIRAAFEALYSSNGKYPAVIMREPDGMYTLMQTSTAWVNFRDGYEAALATAKNDLEEAAKACEDEATIEGIAQRCAARIRALVKP